MKIRSDSDLTDLLKNLKKRGYTHTFKLQGDKLYCLENKNYYSPEDLLIVEYHHLNKAMNQMQAGLIFAIKCVNGYKGILNASTTGLDGIQLLKFADQIKIEIRED